MGLGYLLPPFRIIYRSLKHRRPSTSLISSLSKIKLGRPYPLIARDTAASKRKKKEY